VPAAQFTQLTEVDAPVAPRNVPETQLVHAEVPVDSAYAPAVQLRHDSALSEPTNRPTAQLVQADADAPEYLPAEQAEHAIGATAPAVPSSVPAGHPTQAIEPVSGW